jgi:uncharacterized LabA/DUF88 family protein
MKRAFVFIDGNNFYHRLRELGDRLGQKRRLLEFDYRGFVDRLIVPHQLVGIRYYVGAIRRSNHDERSERLYADQQKLLARLERQGIHHSLGTLIRHPDQSFHEKGVDVRLAVEMIRYARENTYDIAYRISSDTDLVAAVEEVQSFGKSAQYVGIVKGQSFGLTKAADDVRLLRPEDVDPFLPHIL